MIGSAPPAKEPDHVPSLDRACARAAGRGARLAPAAPGGVLVDGTLGGGGHTRALAERVGPQGLVLAMDRDPAAVAAAGRPWPACR